MLKLNKLSRGLFQIYPAMDESDTELSPGEKISRRPPPKHKIKNQEDQSEAERVLTNLDKMLSKMLSMSSARERRLNQKYLIRKTDQTVPNTATEGPLEIEKKGHSLCIEVKRDDVISSPPTILPPNQSPVTPVLPEECPHELSPKQVKLAPKKLSLSLSSPTILTSDVQKQSPH